MLFFVTYFLPVYSKFCKKTFYTKNGVQIFMILMCKTVWFPTNHTMQTLCILHNVKKPETQKNR